MSSKKVQNKCSVQKKLPNLVEKYEKIPFRTKSLKYAHPKKKSVNFLVKDSFLRPDAECSRSPVAKIG